MRKKLLSVLLSCLLAVVAYAGVEDEYVLHEGFEGGVIPAGWTLEYMTPYQQPWVVESGATSVYPTGSMSGDYHVALRNQTQQTQNFVSRLISPVINIKETFQPILVFSHVQAQRTGDVDTLRVYYRTSSESRWVKIGEYGKKFSRWQRDTISLPGASETYQVAFEGTDNMGRGIALDEIIVRPMPTCSDPTAISVDGLTSTSVLLRWNGSLDTDSFRVVLTKKEVSGSIDEVVEEDIVDDVFVEDFQYSIDKLSRNTRYWVYIQAYCQGSTSEWSSPYTFTTKNLTGVPYVYDFNKAYAQSTVSHADYWTHGTSIRKEDGSMEYMPFINQNTSETSRGSYSYSNSTCFVFSGARNLTTAIPAGQYVYAATPEMDVKSVQGLQVSFWGTAYNFVGLDTKTGEEYASGLIVGVMTDPEDFSTFVPVDTVYIEETNSFDRFAVFFDKYAGEGKYIAFASNFMDKNNIFFLDDVTIKERETVSEVTNIRISNILAGQFTVNGNMNGNAQVEVVVTKDTTDAMTHNTPLTPDGLPASCILARGTTSSLPYTVNLDVTGCFVQVYIHPVGSDVYALPIKVQIPKKWNGTDALLIDFESDDNIWSTRQIRNLTSLTYNYTLPYELVDRGEYACGTAMWPSRSIKSTATSLTAHTGNYGMYMKKTQQVYASGKDRCGSIRGEYIALPQCDNIQDVYLQFYMKTYGSTAKNTSRVAVGVMTDPFDYSTFDTLYIAEAPDTEWRSFAFTFTDYKGTGKFPAIMSVDASERYLVSTTSSSTEGTYYTYYTSSQYIDDISITKNSGCKAPANMSASVTDTTLILRWSANGADKWVGHLYKDKDGTDTLATETLTSAEWLYKGLSSHTTYYYSVGTVCESDTIYTDITSFRTLCHDIEPIPYIEGFETWKSSTVKGDIQPSNWTYEKYATTTTTYYPYVYSYASGAHTGVNSFSFYYPSGATDTCVLALPLMAEDLNKLQMSFYAKPAGVSYVGDTLFVGIMSDPKDIATLDTIGVAVLSNKDYQEYIVRFNNYKGVGKYIAFAKPAAKASRGIYIDDIKVDYLSDCEKIQGVYTRNSTTVGTTVYWTKGDATEWDVLLTNKEMTLGSIVATGNDSVISMGHATSMPYTITDCPDVNTPYYVYVRSVCSETNKGDWSSPASFRTTCEAKEAGELGTIDFTHTDELSCWTVGVREGTTAAPSRNTNNYLYMFNTDKSDGAYAIMPLLDIDSISRLEVSFDAHGGTGIAYLRELTVGIISNPNDLSTFVAIKKVSLNRVSSMDKTANFGFDKAYRYTIPFDAYDGDYNGDYGKYIMFLSESGDKYNYVYIRNVKIDTIPACQKPIEITVTAGVSDATFAFESTTDNYRLQILDSDKKIILKDTLVSGNAVIPGLSYATTYWYLAKHSCSATDSSAWSHLRAFDTECPVAFDLPYSEDFDSYASGAGNLPSCWESFTNSSTAYPYVNSSAKRGATGNGFYLYRYTSYYSTAVLPKFVNAPQELTINFYYRNVSTTSYKAYLEVGVATDITSYSALDSTFVCLDSIEIEPFKAPNNNWLYYSKSLDGYTGADGYIVLRAPKADKSANSGAVYIDDLYIEKSPTCFRPTYLNMLASSPTSITVSWSPGGKETAWDVAYVAKDGDIDAATIVPVSKDTFEITGLTASTEYDIYVRANCGSGDVSTWSDVLTASTYTMVEIADAHWNFDEADKHVAMPERTSEIQEKGWLFRNRTSGATYSYIPYLYENTYNTTGNKTRNAHYALSDTCALMIWSSTSYNGAYAVLPYVNADLNTLQIRFSGRCLYATGSKVTNTDSVYNVTTASSTYQRGIQVGTLTNPYDLSTFEVLTDYQFKEVTDKNTIDPDGYWEEVIVPLYGAQGKYIALVSDYPMQNRVYIDNVVVEAESGCAAPTALKTDSLGETYIGLSWKSSKSAWNVKLTDADDKVILSENNLTAAKWSTNTLNANTSYTFSVQAICDAENTSAWSSVTFTTDCGKYDTTTFKINFEDDLYKYVGTYEIPQCWFAGQLVKSAATTNTYMPQAIKNTTTYQYSRNLDVTSGRALRFYNTSSYYNSYVVLPELDVDMDSTSLHFWARAAYFYSPSYSNTQLQNRLYSVNNNYQRSIVIGAISDMEDLTTFVPLDTFTYSQSWSTNTNIFATGDQTGNNYWEEVIIPLKKYKDKGHIVILYPGNGKTSYFFIDDMDIVASDFCSAPSNLRVRDITANSAQLNWVTLGLDSVQLQVATDEEFATPLLDTVLYESGGVYRLDKLGTGTTYYARVLHFCSSEEVSDWTNTVSFTTNDAVRFYEPFSEVRTYPLRWNRANAVPADIFDKEIDIATKYVAETGTNWARTATYGDIYSSTSTGTSSTCNYWLLTPIIDLSTTDAESISLSFLLGLTSNSNGLPNPTLVDDKFIVAVSEDAGASWKSANTTYWSDAEADNAAFSYAAIPYTKSIYQVDLTRYAGKQIRIAFINSSTKTASKNYLHLDNVSVNGVTISNYAQSICRWEDYEDANFSIDAYNLVIGNTVYSHYVQATKDGEKDYYTTLNLQVICDTITPFKATICEGEDYTENNFDIKNATSSGVYKQKLSGANTCDSTVTLDLTVLPRLRKEIHQTICQGDFYTFNGVKYYTNVIHSDTLTSLVTGCDSIVTLYLTVNEILRGESDAHLCPGGSIVFGKFGEITEAGIYVDTLKNAINCDSVATLHVYAHTTAKSVTRGLICQGDTYSKDVWSGLSQAGDYPSKQQTVWGCDSIATLHLMVAGSDLQVRDTITVDALPYVLDGEELLPAGTTEGVYTKTVTLRCGSATLTIVVGEPTGLHTVFASSLAVAPNPVHVGQSFRILGSFASDATLEVFSTTGACVYRAMNVDSQMTVPGLPVAGVYLVVVTSDNQAYQAKVVVK